jgi:MYXO-CTERM domain-containing protein
MRKSRSCAAALGLAALHVVAVAVESSRAQTATFQVDPAGSSLTVSGTALGSPILSQGPGSLTTTYQGPLLLQLTPSTIEFPGGSAVAANNSGNWLPLPGGASGSAPANYGARVIILFQTNLAAVRNAVFDVTTLAPLPLSGSGNTPTFSSTVDFTSTSGDMDYNSALAGSGTAPLAGSTGTNASTSSGALNISAGSAGFASGVLNLPIDFTINTAVGTLGQATFRFQGAMTARGSARGGDSNFDGIVNLTDFNALASNFGAQTGAGWLQGDFTFDGRVNLDDFNVLAGNFGMTAGANGPTQQDWTTLGNAVVPEPLAIALLALATLPLRRRRRTD